MDSKNYKALFEQSSAVQIASDRNYSVAAVSDAYLKITGSARESIEKRNIFELFPLKSVDSRQVKKCKAAFNRVLKNKTEEELPVVRINGPDSNGADEKYWKPVFSPILDENDNVVYVIQRLEDVTEQELSGNNQFHLLPMQSPERKALLVNGGNRPYLEDSETITGVKEKAYKINETDPGRKKADVSEDRFRTLVEESTIATALYEGPDIIVKYANDIMLNYWGKDESAIGKPLIEAVPELKGQKFISYLKNVYKTGKTYKGLDDKAELKVDGRLQTFYFSYTYKAIRDENGKIFGIHHTAQDVTEEVIAKKALEKSETTLKQLLNTMPQKLSHTDAEGKAIFFNRQWMNETGLTLEELKNHGWIKTIHQEDISLFKKEWYNAILSGSLFECECRILNKELGYRWNLSRAVPIKDKSGEIIMWVTSCTDVHEHKMQKETLERAVWERTKELHQANKELLVQNKEKEKQKKELMVANKELESFAYISSHDLQEPLRKIQTFAGRIRDKENHKLSKKGQNYFDRLQRSAERMRILIDDLLTFSRVNSADNRYEQTSLKSILDEVLDEFRETIEEKNATITSSEFCDVKVIVFQFRQLLKNLIANAIKYSKEDIAPHITINSKIVIGRQLNSGTHGLPAGLFSSRKYYCHITVEDNGIGFESKYKDRIFEVFQRLHSRDEYEGTGIGLAIVKKIVDNHNGIITAESEPGKGTRFNIVIPAD